MLEYFLLAIVLLLSWLVYREYYKIIRVSQGYDYVITCKKKESDGTYLTPYPVHILDGSLTFLKELFL